MIHHRTHRDAVIYECQRMATLLRALADSADRHFNAPIDEPDFETRYGSDYEGGMEFLRIQIERFAMRTKGIDPELDEAFYAYYMDALRADPGATKPELLRIN